MLMWCIIRMSWLSLRLGKGLPFARHYHDKRKDHKAWINAARKFKIALWSDQNCNPYNSCMSYAERWFDKSNEDKDIGLKTGLCQEHDLPSEKSTKAFFVAHGEMPEPERTSPQFTWLQFTSIGTRKWNVSGHTHLDTPASPHVIVSA